MAERSFAGRVRRAVADAAAATRLVGSGNAARADDDDGQVPALAEVPALEDAPDEPPATRKRARSTTAKPAGTARTTPITTPAPAAATPPPRKRTAKAPATESPETKTPATKTTKTPATRTPATKAGTRRAAGRTAATTSERAAAPATAETTTPDPTRPAPAAVPAAEAAAEAATEPRDPAGTAGPRPAPGPAATPAATGFVVGEHDDPWSAAEIDEIRRELTTDLKRLQAEVADADAGIADLLSDPTGVGGEDQADAGTKTFEREHEMALAASHRELLAQTERALLRLDDGTFGRCESCGNAVGKARVQAFPRATLCLACKQREERR